ncbi:calcium-binding protein [Pseudidiomarina sediminum]|uniref:Calcium-binding protein n=1 Tax=Pseudidiomarina sediminum TaxID=431675 RepID=A0A432ZAT8_9GAMM|nr:calcium-binding protein [Pseudidiomarina sediminum]
MRKLLLLVIIVYVCWHYYSLNKVTSAEQPALDVAPPSSYQPTSTHSGFKCDGRTHCSQMTSRAEAEFFIRNCPGTKMDGDYDGIPCENDSRF